MNKILLLIVAFLISGCCSTVKPTDSVHKKRWCVLVEGGKQLLQRVYTDAGGREYIVKKGKKWASEKIDSETGLKIFDVLIEEGADIIEGGLEGSPDE